MQCKKKKTCALTAHDDIFLQEPRQAEANGQKELSLACESSGRAKRTSAQVAVFHLREIANQEMLKEWPKRKVQRDLVPDDRKVGQCYEMELNSLCFECKERLNVTEHIAFIHLLGFFSLSRCIRQAECVVWMSCIVGPDLEEYVMLHLLHTY